MTSSSVAVCARVVSLETPGKTTRVLIRICNLLVQTIKIPPHSSLFMLNVEVVDSWQPKPPKTSVVAEDVVISSLENLDIKINHDSLTPDQLQRTRQVLKNLERQEG